MGLSEAYARRRKRELEAMGAIIATAVSEPKKLDRVVKLQPSRLHGGRQRQATPWWKR